jgi:hypothetical protein
MKKLVLLLTILFTSMTGWSKCDFSGITFEKFAQQGNEMYFRTNMDMDDCWRYFFTAYDYQLKRIDTLEDWGGRTGVAFYVKGKYQMRLNVVNVCEKCDTMLTLEVDITIFGNVKLDYKPNIKNCRLYEFGMTNFDDTCTEYYHVVWRADDYIKSMTEKEWEEVTYVELYNKYTFEDYEAYNEESQRTWKHEFRDSGRYLVTTTYLNKCTGIDTFTIHKLDICKPFKTTSTKTITKEDLKNVTVVGYYDMLGRNVDYIEPNKVYVVLYSDGRRVKFMRSN